MGPWFITFEGGEGGGKSTQIARLSRRLRDEGVETLATREPGGSPRAERIRRALLAGHVKRFGPLAEAVMFAAARADHLAATIRPALARGVTVLCDRFLDSTRAYQGMSGGVPPDLLRALDGAVVGATRPDLTLVLDLPPEVGLARAAARRQAAGEGADRFEGEDALFHGRLREAFRAIAAAEPERCVVIDATPSPDDVERAVWAAVAERLLRRHAPGPGAPAGEEVVVGHEA